MRYALAIDIGASSGRHILGWYEDEKLVTKEVYRFDNNFIKQDGSLIWDIETLFFHVREGIKVCGELGMIPATVAIDTWGVDYVLLDSDKKEILPAYSYRDSRTGGIADEVSQIIPDSVLYSVTGIQKQNFNTIYQLYCDKKSGKLQNAAYCLMIPAYLSYRLTGVLKNEYTDASTTGLLNATERTIDSDVMQKLGINPELFGEILMPGSKIGRFTEEVRSYVGYDATVLFCPSHDTASAVAACPMEPNDVFISSGTWSLIGLRLASPILTDQARETNFTNEGGAENTYRFLKNYMGMWLLQNIRRNIDKSLSYDEMMHLAMECDTYEYIDVNAEEFVAPESMIEAVKRHLNKPEMTLAQVLNSVYHSLARAYAQAVSELEAIAQIQTNAIRIVGGGSKDTYLNRLTEEYTQKKVFAGPVEATATGNLISQLKEEI